MPLSALGGKSKRKTFHLIASDNFMVLSPPVFYFKGKIPLKSFLFAVQLHNAVRQIHHKDLTFDHPGLTHDIPEDHFLSVHINAAYHFTDDRVVTFSLDSCKTHSVLRLL